MASRVTQAEINQVFEWFLAAFGFREAASYKDVGGMRLDWNPTYGGLVIEEVVSEGGGVSHPFGSMRQSPREFVQSLRFAMGAAERAARGGARIRGPRRMA